MASNASLLQFFENFSQYPRSYASEYQDDLSIGALEKQLDIRSKSIFDDESNSYVDFCETTENSRSKFAPEGIEGYEHLKGRLFQTVHNNVVDPKCRFIFVHAPHSRYQLRISLGMMKQILHYHQVMPCFLEHIFPFRNQYTKEDFHIAGFRSQPCINEANRFARIPRLNRSGRHLEFCYNLKSVESTGESEDPWRVRQCSIYHQFDLEWQRANWIVVKGNEDARDLIRSRICGQNPYSIGDSVGSSLKFSLKIHLEFCKWAARNWHWHINLLESKLQDSRRALSARIHNLYSRTRVQRGVSVTTVSTNATEKSPVGQNGPWIPNSSTTSEPTTMGAQGKANGSPTIQQQPGSDPKVALLRVRQQAFSFKDIQQAHSLEEKVNDCLLVVQANSQVVCQLKREYHDLLDSENCPEYIVKECKSAVKEFTRSIDGICSEFMMIQCRLQTLLRLVQERKTLLYGILQYENMEANRDLAEKSHDCAQKMEGMTLKMQGIAEKTLIDTASMKTITTVTLFFLPGTFISTVMSTPIVRFKNGTTEMADREIGYGALKLFAVISVPLMILTFAAWILVNRLEKRKARKRDPSMA